MTECPDPARCPVPDPPGGASDFGVVVLPAGTVVWRTYQLKFGYDEYNPGIGDTRFAPLITATGPVPTLYCGNDAVVVLLEALFHDVHQAVGDRIVYEGVVRNWGLAQVRLPRDVRLVDVRNPALTRCGLARPQLVATTAAHYPCTRRWAQWFHAVSHSGADCEGIAWHSRQAELHLSADDREVYLFFGDRAPAGRGVFPLAGPGVLNLVEGPGRLLLERIAEELDARVEPSGW